MEVHLRTESLQEEMKFELGFRPFCETEEKCFGIGNGSEVSFESEVLLDRRQNK